MSTGLHKFEAWNGKRYGGNVVSVIADSHGEAARIASTKLGCSEDDIVLRYKWPEPVKMVGAADFGRAAGHG